MIPRQDTHEQASRCGSHCTEVDVKNHEQGYCKTTNNVDYIGQDQSRVPDNDSREKSRKHHIPSGEDNKGEEQLHDHDVGKLLQRIELLFPCDCKRILLSLKYTDQIIMYLVPQSPAKPFQSYPVVFSIGREQVPGKKDQVADTQQDATGIMNPDNTERFNCLPCVLHD